MSSQLAFNLPKPSIDSVQVHLLGTEGILFCRASKQLYYLNTTAAYIWCALLEGAEPATIAEDIAAQFGISRDRALHDVTESLFNWTAKGMSPRGQQDSSSPTAPAPSPPGAVESGVEFIPAASHVYSLGVQRFLIRYASESAAARVHPALAHLETSAKTTASNSPIPINVALSGGHYCLRVRGDVYSQGLTEEELTPLIHRIMLSHAFESSDCLAAFHAGVVANSHGSVLLPGLPGSGKSTLVAALVDSGCRYFTDELTLLMPDHTLSPLPVSLGLKRGAWPLFPAALENQPVNRQPDGTEVRYLCTTAAQHACPPLQALIFPRYKVAAKTQLTKLSPARAIYELSVAGYAVKHELNSELVSRLAAWIAPISCYQLQVGELNSAVSTVRNILP